MATTADPGLIAKMEAALAADAEYRRLRQIAMSSPRPSNVAAAKARGHQVLSGQGLELPHDYDINPNGTIQRRGFLQRNQDWIGAVAAAPMAYGLTFGPAGLFGSSAGPATSQFQQVGPTTTSLANLGSGIDWDNIENQVVDRVSKKGGSRLGGLLTDPDFWSTVFGAGVGLYGAKTQADAARDAQDLAEKSADRQAKALEDAIALQKEMYEKDRLLQQGLYSQNRSDLAPYRAAGQGSIGKLSYLLGVPGFESGPTAYHPLQEIDPFANANSPVPTAPGTSLVSPTRASQAQLTQSTPQMPQTQQPEAMVMLEAPDGTRKEVPAKDAPFYISKGAKRV